MKLCTRCKKPNINPVLNNCRACRDRRREQKARQYERDPELKIREREKSRLARALRFERDPEKKLILAEKQKDWRALNPHKVKEWPHKNKAKRNKTQKEWVMRHHDIVLARRKAGRIRDKEYRAEWDLTYGQYELIKRAVTLLFKN